MKERLTSVVFGFVLVGGGLFYFITPLEFLAFLMGLMLIGFGIVPEPEHMRGMAKEVPKEASAMEREPKEAKPAPKRKRRARKKAA